MTDYYDKVLVSIPIALLGIPALLATLGQSVVVGAAVGAIIAGTMMGHALFVNAPVHTSTRDDLPLG